jgi:hypothetical protein
MAGSKKFSNNKAQALVELAVFGSILLFCVAILIQYALDGNYSQQTQMEAFRKALRLAYYKSGPADSSSIVLVKDKPIPDPRDQWGFGERYPITGSGSAVWDNALAGGYVKSFSGKTNTTDLPSVYFEIASEKPNAPPEAKVSIPKEAGNQVFGFYTAQFERLPCSSAGTLTIVLDDTNCPKLGSSAGCNDYRTQTVSCNDIKVMLLEEDGARNDITDDTELLMSAYYKDPTDGLKYRISSADLDGDGELEEIIAANMAKDFLYIDYHTMKDQASKQGSIQGTAGLQIDNNYMGLSPYPYGPPSETMVWHPPATITEKEWRVIGQHTEMVTWYKLECCVTCIPWFGGPRCSGCYDKIITMDKKERDDTECCDFWDVTQCKGRTSQEDKPTMVDDYGWVDVKKTIPGYWETVGAGPKDKQGILSDFQKVITHTGSSIEKSENSGSITSKTNLKANQKIIHKIRLNNGQVLDISADFTAPSSELYNWPK